MYGDFSGCDPVIIFMILLLGSLISIAMIAILTPNAEVSGPAIEKPVFLSSKNKGKFLIFSTKGRVANKRWELFNGKMVEIYISVFNFEFTILKWDEKETTFLDLDWNFWELGYKTDYFSASIQMGVDPIDVSINFDAIFKKMYSLFRQIFE